MVCSTATGSRCARLWQAVALSTVVLLAGCADDGQRRTGKVSGTVTLNGTPLSAGTLLFMADDGQGDSAELESAGTYSLKLCPGNYKVSVSPPPTRDPLGASGGDAKANAKADAIPRKYQDCGSSGLTAEVKDGDNTVDIVMTSR